MAFGKRTFPVVLGLLALLAVSGVRAADESSSSAVRGDSAAAAPRSADEVPAVSETAVEEGTSVAYQLLKDAVDQGQKLDKAAKTAKKWNLALLGVGGATGLGLLTSLGASYRSAPGKARSLGMAASFLGMLSLAGAAYALMKKKKMEQRAIAEARELLRQREVMLKHVAEVGKQEGVDEVERTAEEIAKVAESMGLYVQDPETEKKTPEEAAVNDTNDW